MFETDQRRSNRGHPRSHRAPVWEPTLRSLRDVRARLNDLRRQLDEIERDAHAAIGEHADRGSGSFMSALRKLNRHSLS